MKVSKPYDERINLKTLAYRYKDKYYKCYSEERLYVPGYYEELEGFIKDEEKELVLKTNTVYEEKEEPKEEQKEEVQEEIKEEQEEIKELDSNEEQEVVKTLEKEENDNIIATNYKTSEERNDFNFIYTYIIIFIILALLLSLLIIITKKVKKSRMK